MSILRNRVGWYIDGDSTGVVTTDPAKIIGILSRHSTGGITLSITDKNGVPVWSIRTRAGFQNDFNSLDIALPQGFKIAASSTGWGELVIYEEFSRSR